MACPTQVVATAFAYNYNLIIVIYAQPLVATIWNHGKACKVGGSIHEGGDLLSLTAMLSFSS